jgi:hypothetical protein
MFFAIKFIKILMYISNVMHSSSEYDLYREEIITENFSLLMILHNLHRGGGL